MLTIDDLAKKLNVKPSWVRAQIFKGAIPIVKVGRHVRFEPEAISRWILERNVTGRGGK